MEQDYFKTDWGKKIADLLLPKQETTTRKPIQNIANIAYNIMLTKSRIYLITSLLKTLPGAANSILKPYIVKNFTELYKEDIEQAVQIYPRVTKFLDNESNEEIYNAMKTTLQDKEQGKGWGYMLTVLIKAVDGNERQNLVSKVHNEIFNGIADQTMTLDEVKTLMSALSDDEKKVVLDNTVKNQLLEVLQPVNVITQQKEQNSGSEIIHNSNASNQELATYINNTHAAFVLDSGSTLLSMQPNNTPSSQGKSSNAHVTRIPGDG